MDNEKRDGGLRGAWKRQSAAQQQAAQNSGNSGGGSSYVPPVIDNVVSGTDSLRIRVRQDMYPVRSDTVILILLSIKVWIWQHRREHLHMRQPMEWF